MFFPTKQKAKGQAHGSVGKTIIITIPSQAVLGTIETLHLAIILSLQSEVDVIQIMLFQYHAEM